LLILLKVSFIQSEGFSPNEKIIWEGTDDWDTLLLKERRFQEVVLSDFTKEALNQFKK
jgi:methylglutaconyl-CoA hydratase